MSEMDELTQDIRDMTRRLEKLQDDYVWALYRSIGQSSLCLNTFTPHNNPPKRKKRRNRRKP